MPLIQGDPRTEKRDPRQKGRMARSKRASLPLPLSGRCGLFRRAPRKYLKGLLEEKERGRCLAPGRRSEEMAEERTCQTGQAMQPYISGSGLFRVLMP